MQRYIVLTVAAAIGIGWLNTPVYPQKAPKNHALLSGQVSEERVKRVRNRKRRLERISRRHNDHFRRTRPEIEAKARRRKIPIRKVLRNNRIMALVKWRNDQPVYYLTDNLDSAESSSTDLVWPGGGAGFSLTGSGVTIGMWDGGEVRSTHTEFGGRVTQIDSPAGLSAHSTHVAGTLIASGASGPAKGMSHAADLQAWDFLNDTAEMTTASSGGLLISNHSYGFITGWFFDGDWHWYGDTGVDQDEDWGFGFYSTDAADWDEIAFNAPNYLIFKSAGNDRNDGPGGTVMHTHSGGGTFFDSHEDDGGASGFDTVSFVGVAKNIVTVGAVEDISGGWSMVSDVVMSDFSGFGPADDGRIKPDLVANGVSLFSPVSASNSSYGLMSGTSMSSPSAAGSAGLLMEYQNTLYGTNMLSSTLKGLLIHTADEAGAWDGPDYSFGWGMLNTRTAADLMKDDSDKGGGFHIREFELRQGEKVVVRVRSDGGSPLKATICWTDPKGTPPAITVDNTTPVLVNDLDLRIQNGATFFPWKLDGASPSSSATQADNTVDNVEQVVIPSPAAGLFDVEITHKGTITDGPQEFSLIISGNSIAPILMITSEVFEDRIFLESSGTTELGTNVRVESGADLSVEAGSDIRLKSGFRAEQGSSARFKNNPDFEP